MRPLSWQLGSSNGYSRLVCDGASTRASELSYDVRLDYGPPAEIGLASSAELTQVQFSQESLIGLCERVRAFVGRPLAEIKTADLRIAIDLAASASETVGIRFGPSIGLVTGTDDIGCQVVLRRGRFQASSEFVTDLTCLDQLVNELRPVLAAASPVRRNRAIIDPTKRP